MTRPALLILGASARAAAASAARAGFAPIGVDLFADRDLAAIGPAHRVGRDDYPEALIDLAARMPDAPWIYTGGLENHPDLIDRIARDRPLLGIGGEALRAVRDPARWTEALLRAGLPALHCVVSGEGPSEPGAYLLKPRASAGGRRIRHWSPGMGTIPGGWYVQAVARGVSLGACFVGIGPSARLVGVTRQLLRRSEGGPAVVYRGSVGPWPLATAARRAIARLGDVLAGAFGLRGLFGVDLLLDGASPWAVEINPRYMASVEVMEEALGVSLLGDHVRAFETAFDRPGPLRPGGVRAETARRRVAKLVLRARRPGVVPDGWPWSDPIDPRPVVADIPAAGTVLRPGDPVLTVFARGPSIRAALDRLGARAARWRRRIDGWPSP